MGSMDLLDFHTTRKLLLKNKELKLKVASDSMNPVLKVGEVIKVLPYQVKNLDRFDVIVFWNDNKLISHFLWSKQCSEDGTILYITKSLKHALEIDIPIKEDMILGKVDVKIPLLRKVVTLFKNYLKNV